MKNIRFLLSEKFHFLVVQFSVYLNRHGFPRHAFRNDMPSGLSTLFVLVHEYVWDAGQS